MGIDRAKRATEFDSGEIGEEPRDVSQVVVPRAAQLEGLSVACHMADRRRSETDVAPSADGIDNCKSVTQRSLWRCQYVNALEKRAHVVTVQLRWAAGTLSLS